MRRCHRGEHRSASSPRPSHESACARTKFGSGPAPARAATSASRSARVRSASQTAPWAALTSRSASGVRSEWRLNVARRTTTCMSSRLSATASCGDQSAGPWQPGRCRASAAHFTVEGVCHPHFHAASDGLERNEAAGIGLLDRSRISDPGKGRQSMGSPTSTSSR